MAGIVGIKITSAEEQANFFSAMIIIVGTL
jgi:hypothetical protein